MVHSAQTQKHTSHPVASALKICISSNKRLSRAILIAPDKLLVQSVYGVTDFRKKTLLELE